MILIAIKPAFSSEIFAGRKKVEFRRTPPNHGIPGFALVYESAPISRISGYMRIAEARAIFADTASDLAGRQDPYCSLYATYLSGAKRPTGLLIEEARRFKELISLKDLPTPLARPPQSFCYIQGADWDQWIADRL